MSFKTVLYQAARLLRRNRVPGYIDHFDTYRVAGWAYDPADRTAPALLTLHIDGNPEMNIVADIVREDVQAAGLGPLRCGFDTPLPRRLRNGKAHVVQIRLGSDGPVLNGGTLRIPARADLATEPADETASASGDETSASAANAASQLPAHNTAEGLVYLDRARGALCGWAIGCNSVSVCFDDGVPERFLLDREVPGFGSGLRPGFRIPVPAAFCDGSPHVAHVFFGNGGDLLDGAPVRFSLGIAPPRVEIAAQEGARLTLRLRSPDGDPVSRDDVLFYADGALLAMEAVSGGWSVELPDKARWLIAAQTDGRILARFRILGADIVAEPPRDLPDGALSEDGCAAARAAFEAFCAAPDDRFDPLWYRWAHPGARGMTDPADLIAHYAGTGAPEGTGPGPWFDEAAARRRYPALAEAISHGALPCAFALELALGRGSLDTLTDADPATILALATGRGDRLDALNDPAPTPVPPAPLPQHLPAAVAAQDPARAIYAAWVSRMQASDAQKTEIETDDFAMRQDIAATALTRRPLVTIIMPSWNRAFTIGEAIQSVLEQSYPNWELIICDDASEDRTAEVVRGFDDPRIRYMKFLKSNGAGARNKGLRHARGEYIAYLDSDNIWHPLFLDMMLRQLMSYPGQSIAYCAYLDTEITGARVELQAIPRPNFRPIRLSSKNFMDLNTIVHHRRVYDWLGGFDGALPRLQDWDLSLRYTSIFRPVYVNRIGVFYRRNVAWGQVTHLFMGGDAQNTVNEKTRRRLTGGHERLAIAWPSRSRVTVLCGGPLGHRPTLQDTAIARTLARLLAPVADVDLVELGQDIASMAAQGQLPAAVRYHAIPEALQRSPARLVTALGGLLQGRPLLSVGPRGSYLRALAGADPALIWRLLAAGEGSVLQSLDNPLTRFDLGALPIPLPSGTHDPAGLTMLLLLPNDSTRKTLASDDKLLAETQRRGLVFLVPPGAGHGWRRFDKTGQAPLDPDPLTALPAELGQVALTASMVPVSDLDSFGLGLLNALQGQGVPAAVLPDEGRARATGFARQWIEAKAAYGIQVNDLKWIGDKARKLLGDSAGMERLADRSRTVHSIAWHPDLARERLYHALYRILHDTPKQELINARGR